MFHFISSDSSPSNDWPGDKQKFCNAPRTSIAFNPKESSDSEATKLPTSSLNIKTFSGVGLSHWHENSLDSQLSSHKQQRETIPIGSPHGFTKSNHQTGMKISESYTCVISHGSKSSIKTMYNHCGMECESVQYPVRKQNEHEIWAVVSPPPRNSNVAVFPVTHFLSACYLCKRKLNHGKDIYMYRGDKAFCSVECRYQQIFVKIYNFTNRADGSAVNGENHHRKLNPPGILSHRLSLKVVSVRCWSDTDNLTPMMLA